MQIYTYIYYRSRHSVFRYYDAFDEKPLGEKKMYARERSRLFNLININDAQNERVRLRVTRLVRALSATAGAILKTKKETAGALGMYVTKFPMKIFTVGFYFIN